MIFLIKMAIACLYRATHFGHIFYTVQLQNYNTNIHRCLYLKSFLNIRLNFYFGEKSQGALKASGR